MAVSCYTAAVTHKNNLSDQRHSQYWVLPLVTCFASCSMPQQVTSSFSYKAQLLALLAPRTAHFMLRIINLCRLALVSTLVGFMQADKAATDAMAKKIAKPAVQSQSYRSNCLSPALRRKVLPTSTRNIEVAELAPRQPLETLVGIVPTKVSNTSHPKHCLCFCISIFSETA